MAVSRPFIRSANHCLNSDSLAYREALSDRVGPFGWACPATTIPRELAFLQGQLDARKNQLLLWIDGYRRSLNIRFKFRERRNDALSPHHAARAQSRRCAQILFRCARPQGG